MKACVISCFFAAVMFCVGSQAHPRQQDVNIVTTGSAPPGDQFYGCAYSFREITYEEKAAQTCLHSIISSGKFDSGNVKVLADSSNKLQIVFELHSPLLTVSQLEFDSSGDMKGLQPYVVASTGVLQRGGVYTKEAQRTTFEKICQFFYEHKRRVSVDSQAYLDYKKKFAIVKYVTTEGPPGPGPGDMEFYKPDPNCAERIVFMDFRDSDDFVPMSLVHRLVAIRVNFQLTRRADSSATRCASTRTLWSSRNWPCSARY